MADPKQQSKYDAIVLEPNMAARMRLKSATVAVVDFGKVELLGELREGLSRLEKGPKVDVVFLTHTFPDSDITNFIKTAKTFPAGQDAAYVLMMKNDDRDSALIAGKMLIGGDGFLFEPYSVDQLRDITLLSGKVKLERTKARDIAAITFLVNDIVNQINEVAYIKGCQFDIGASIKKLRDKCAVFDQLGEESVSLYYDLALKIFEDTPVPKVEAKKYPGVSSRVKKRMAAKLMADLEKTREGGPTTT